jgi:hypothetical protein
MTTACFVALKRQNSKDFVADTITNEHEKLVHLDIIPPAKDREVRVAIHIMPDAIEADDV